jgi:cellulose synthase/poly-beta-1,6-N-acetylglucosamine synthase-like glycosyltransferase
VLQAVAVAAATLALLPLLLALFNLRLFRAPAERPPPGTSVSILIPARNEEENIAECVMAALASRDVTVEVIVLDDHSDDRTAAIVEGLAHTDSRVRLERAPPLPAGWCGKQHACHVLAQRARCPVLLFIDADVRLAPEAAGSAAGFLLSRDIGLASGFPRQITESAAERLMIPLVHLLLLGYLPMALMRRRLDVGLGAGCGQFIIVRKDSYISAGGHAMIRSSLHDGLMLPRAFRRANIMTGLFDATELAACRMYRGGQALWSGFTKNATEGMAAPRALPVWTVLLLGGHVLPWALLPLSVAASASALAVIASAAGVFANVALRAALAGRFRQSWAAILCHPLSILALLAMQWSALINTWLGKPASWRGRTYSAL